MLPNAWLETFAYIRGAGLAATIRRECRKMDAWATKTDSPGS